MKKRVYTPGQQFIWTVYKEKYKVTLNSRVGGVWSCTLEGITPGVKHCHFDSYYLYDAELNAMSILSCRHKEEEHV